MISATFEPEKITKNTVRFQEVVGNEYEVPVIGTLYVQKQTLQKLGYREGQSIELNIGINKEEK